jgi:hypothetical protein
MPVPCCILSQWHPMMSFEPETVIIPPAPPVIAPFFAISVLNGVPFIGSATPAPTVSCAFGSAMQMGTDIGKLIPHIGTPNLNLILVIALSKSKSVFGASTVQVENKPVGTACLVFANINLNCGSPVSWPLAAVSAPNTAMAGMSFGDYLAGIIEIVVSLAIDYVMSQLGDHYSNALASRIAGRITGQVGLSGGRIVIEGLENLTAAEIRAIGGRGALFVEALVQRQITDRMSNAPLAAYEAITEEGIERTLGRSAGTAVDGGPPGTPADRATVPVY